MELGSKVALGFDATSVLSGPFLRLDQGPCLARGSLAVFSCKTGE